MPNEVSANKRRSPDEGVQSAAESESSALTSKRSNSVELISAKLVEIDITGDGCLMPPPALSKNATKKTRTKQKKQLAEVTLTEPKQLRITRSKIKQEKMAIESAQSQTSVEASMPPVTQEKQPKESSAAVAKNGGKKAIPLTVPMKFKKNEVFK